VQSLTRPFLHAERLTFTHPRTKERMTFVAPLPADLEAVARAVAPPDLADNVFARAPEA
jgi:23S rRNA pseudouridine1911/1915/1917 synthase